MKKVILLGTSPSAVPIYRALSTIGLEIFPVGSQKSDPLAKVPNWVEEDYSNYQNIEKLAKRIACDFIVPSCNDTAFISATRVANSRRLPGFDLTRDISKLCDKWVYREVLKGSKYEVISFLDWSKRPDKSHDNSRYLHKPRLGHSGIGISVPGKDSASPKKNFFFESFIEGTLHSHSIFLKNSEIVADFFVDEFCVHYDFAVSNSNIPSRLSEDQKLQAREMSLYLAESFGIHTGLQHTQFIASGDGVYPLESMRRCPGDFFGSMVQKATGYDFYSNYVAGFIERDIDSHKEVLPPKAIGRISVYADSAGMVEMENIPSGKALNLYHFSLCRVGELVTTHVSSKSSIILLEYANDFDLWNSIPQGNIDRATLQSGA